MLQNRESMTSTIQKPPTAAARSGEPDDGDAARLAEAVGLLVSSRSEVGVGADLASDVVVRESADVWAASGADVESCVTWVVLGELLLALAANSTVGKPSTDVGHMWCTPPPSAPAGTSTLSGLQLGLLSLPDNSATHTQRPANPTHQAHNKCSNSIPMPCRPLRSSGQEMSRHRKRQWVRGDQMWMCKFPRRVKLPSM